MASVVTVRLAWRSNSPDGSGRRTTDSSAASAARPADARAASAPSAASHRRRLTRLAASAAFAAAAAASLSAYLAATAFPASSSSMIGIARPTIAAVFATSSGCVRPEPGKYLVSSSFRCVFARMYESMSRAIRSSSSGGVSSRRRR